MQFGLLSMDSNVRDVNGTEDKVSGRVEGKEVGISGEREGESDSEKEALLLPRAGGISKRPHKPRLKVQWNDKNGNKLVEVLEFQPRK
ncbi:hypothetical protein RJ641_003810 [Dillenia turbinata]|uniref:Uncharacterized protein n=1 Tax=Dillenia turbinata TaxID=194707 RepID=A0AAN8Z994_9MAGN